MVKDEDTNSKLIPMILKLLDDTDYCNELKVNLLKMSKPNASEHIVDEVVKIGKLA